MSPRCVALTACRVSVSPGDFLNPVDSPVTYWSADATATAAPPSDASGCGTGPADEYPAVTAAPAPSATSVTLLSVTTRSAVLLERLKGSSPRPSISMCGWSLAGGSLRAPEALLSDR
ncbi:hypothetical protein Ari01nite_73450 [Paractinoplanes rishiriensis]|uniref:Uncharacterized protein n=1 Tax=Paractinoplanes rishiriensis TaxID=1050105 RepID=A0A919K6M2_9ACTN|nr:hypothetical protein Ari01nite_73450 [Actinoplanes rishiriensis]